METDTQEIFVEGIKRLLSDINKERKKIGRKKLTIDEISEKIGVAPNNLSGFLNGHRNYSEPKRVDLAKFFGKSYLEVLDFGRQLLARDGDLSCAFPAMQMIGQSTTQPPPDCSCCSLKDEATKRHQIVIEGFQDRELAIKFNEALVEIESLEPSDFQELYENALTKLRKLREKKGIVQQEKKTVNQ